MLYPMKKLPLGSFFLEMNTKYMDISQMLSRYYEVKSFYRFMNTAKSVTLYS